MGSAEAASTTLFQSLPARPPTPPRETHHDLDMVPSKTKGLLARPTSLSQPLAKSNLNTPPKLYTPDSSTATSTNPSTGKARKRVGFSARAEYKDAPSFNNAERVKRSSPPSASQPKPVKGILKPSGSPMPFDSSIRSDGDSSTSVSISDMLESTAKQLAGTDRDSKLDAYTMIVRALQASNNLPDRIALRGKMGLFVQFIQRDVVALNPNGGLDSALINKALHLLETFLFFSAIASTIPSEFGIFIIDHCIRSLEEPSTPKDVARRLMHVVAIQDFSPRIMTLERVRRLVNALHNLDGHLRGKSIVVFRTRIYRRLITQARPHMAAHTEWLNDVLTDMLSNVKDIRDSAIKLGTEASFLFGKEYTLSRKVMELLETSIEEMTYIEWYHGQLCEMAKGQDKAVVPRIWSVIVLLLRYPLDRWRFSNKWLHLLQTCFNGSDLQCNREANFAWNRFVYTTNLEERGFKKMFSTLYQPLGSQLSKPNIPDQKREVLLGGLCNLYYYAFKPSTNPDHLDNYWDISVKPLTDALVPHKKGPEAVQEHLRRATLILIGLFDSSTPRIWKDDRIKDSSVAKAEELPMIDPKWIRRNASRVFKVISPIMDRQYCDLADKTSLAYRLWRTLVGSVAFAASKEIKVSVDTATFVSEMFSLLLKQWQTGLAQSAEKSATAQKFLRSTQELILTAVEALGLLPFTEKMISLERMNGFSAVSTPSHKPGKNFGDVRAPLQHLFGLLLRLPPGIPDNDDYLLFLRAVFSPFFSTSKSAKARSDLATEMLQTVPNWSAPVSHYPYGPWVFASENLVAAMNASQTSVQTSISSGDMSLGHEYRTIIRLLERGWKETPNLPWEQWHALYAALTSRAVEEVGESGRAIGVIEPLAKIIRESLPLKTNAQVSAQQVQAAVDLVSTASQPQDRHILEAARRRLWGTSVTGSRTASFDPYDNLYKLVNDLLIRLYDLNSDDNLMRSTTPLLGEIANFITRCNSQLVLKSIKNMESGLSVWIQDARGLLSSRRDAAQAEAIKNLWNLVCNILLTGEKPQLENCEQLLCAAFESTHKQIVNTAAEMWNRVFECMTDVQYPEHLKAVLLSSQRIVDLILPGLPSASVPSDIHARSFVDSQDDIDMANHIPLLNEAPPSSTSSRRSPSPGVDLAFSSKQQPDDTPKKTRASGRNTPTARLRHDDSQLHFTAIESSPAVDNGESQALTERQREVRDRQKDASALYTELKSSPRPQARESARRHSNNPSTPSKTEDATPKHRADYEDYVSSTPTPRRGQAVAMIVDEHDMTDPPSSPPEPRPFPLLPQLQSRSSSRGEIEDDWPLSSSPVPGSPVLEGHREVAEQEPAEANLTNEAVAEESQQASQESVSAIDDSFQMDVVPSSAPSETRSKKRSKKSKVKKQPKFKVEPVTPPRKVMVPEDPRSDQEEFVDALTSPQEVTPVRTRSATKAASQSNSQNADSSFAVSDCDEHSMLRLVVELDSRRCKIPLSQHPAESPNKGGDSGVAVLDCITVATPDDEEPPSRGQSPEIPKASHPTGDVPDSVSSKSDKKKKRKRMSSSKQESRRKKRKSASQEDSQTSLLSSSLEETSASEFEAVTKTRGSQPLYPTESIDMGPSPVSTPMRRSKRRNLSEEKENTDTEVESQLVSEQRAASQSHSQPDEDEDQGDELDMEIDSDLHYAQARELTDDLDVPVITPATAEKPATPVSEKMNMLGSLTGVLAHLRFATLSRDEVYRMEDVLMDIKRELYEAERRGRD